MSTLFGTATNGEYTLALQSSSEEHPIEAIISRGGNSQALNALSSALKRSGEDNNDQTDSGLKVFPQPGDPQEAQVLALKVAEECVQEQIDLEDTYKKPIGYLVINRSFIPATKRKYKTQATRNLAMCNKVTEEDIAGMESLMTELNEIVRKSIGSILARKMLNACAEEKIKNSNGQILTNFNQVCKAWQEDPNAELCKQLYNILYARWQDQKEMDSIVGEVMMKLKLWFSGDNASERSMNFVNNGKKKKESFIKAAVRDKIRDIYRNKINDTYNKHHGIKLGITKKNTEEGKKNKRYDNSKFDFARHVQNWGSAKHTEFLAQREQPHQKPSAVSVKAKKKEATGSAVPTTVGARATSIPRTISSHVPAPAATVAATATIMPRSPPRNGLAVSHASSYSLPNDDYDDLSFGLGFTEPSPVNARYAHASDVEEVSRALLDLPYIQVSC